MTALAHWTDDFEENGHFFTDNAQEAIYILPDGRMIDGVFDMGYRDEDHRMIECYVEGLNRYDEGKFWDYVHEELQLIRTVPEEGVALIKQGQQLTREQREVIEESDYKIEEY